MLRRCERVEVFAAIFFEAGRSGHGWPERYARIFAARGGRDADAEQEATRRAVSARRGGWLEYRSSFWRTELLPVAAEHSDSAAPAGRGRRSGRSGRIFRAASQPCATRAFVPQESVGRRSCGGIAGPDALALRCAGFYGVGHSGCESDR